MFQYGRSSAYEDSLVQLHSDQIDLPLYNCLCVKSAVYNLHLVQESTADAVLSLISVPFSIYKPVLIYTPCPPMNIMIAKIAPTT